MLSLWFSFYQQSKVPRSKESDSEVNSLPVTYDHVEDEAHTNSAEQIFTETEEVIDEELETLEDGTVIKHIRKTLVTRTYKLVVVEED